MLEYLLDLHRNKEDKPYSIEFDNSAITYQIESIDEHGIVVRRKSQPEHPIEAYPWSSIGKIRIKMDDE